MTSRALEAVDVVKSYGDLTAVDGLSLTVERGELVAMLGPNGAGKTTSVEMFEGYRQRNSGRLSVLGVDPATAGRQWRSRIGIVLQTASDGTDVSVRDLVSHYSKLYPSTRPVGELIDLVGLGPKAKAKVSTLSGGQRRRLDVALGIVGKPDLLFLDEPTTGFDPEARREFWGLIKLLHEEGTTILLTTHYLAEAEALARRVVVMVGGKVIADAPLEDLGERGGSAATVTWVGPDAVTRSESTTTPAALIARLSSELGGEPERLTVTRPSLEDIYLDLVENAVAQGADT